MKMVLMAGVLLLAGCQTIEQVRADASSGHVGCPADQISTAAHQSLTWTAMCKGKLFYCKTGDGTSCAAALQPG